MKYVIYVKKIAPMKCHHKCKIPVHQHCMNEFSVLQKIASLEINALYVKVNTLLYLYNQHEP